MTSRTTQGSPATDTTVAGRPREDWDAFREAVRALLHDQPSPNLVRAAARRLTLYVLSQADAEVAAREQQSEAEHR
ncbi:hypothetical protein ABZ281_31905 [Streptomyces sp. NPDC006265]|uniref:hypothetical protein n=1 Tax=Streptomyces sp. NPDC006265 TaxID=3156740 RepID=UPI0033A9B411